ncbi:hypothetical protein E4U42_000403 [Claviceps africana]|uniref:Small ribosomal subunit protein uS7m n=1 Tax=Claviceps africana TaxID=83212 RepID=A0A8K0NFK3_9HYPO|nr:hypothetical protein E4U42_000403 [Claviceps africana]
MSPAARIWGACRALAVRTRPIAAAHRNDCRVAVGAMLRTYSSDANRPGPNVTSHPPAEHTSETTVPSSEDVADPADGSEVPYAAQEEDIDVVEGSHLDYLDDAELEQMLYGGRPSTSNREGILTAAQEDSLYVTGLIPPAEEAEALMAGEEAGPEASSTTGWGGDGGLGHKFGLPKKPYPEGFNLKKRYHPVLEQVTRLLMRDGKLSVAQRNVAMVMNFLRTAPAPIYSPKFPLLPGTPPASHLPLNPVLYITIAIDSVAPLLKVRNIAGAGGGGRALELPVPLAVRQRRRIAIKWILDVIEKKPSKGSGKKQFPHRIAEEIIAVVEGRSGVWEKRKQVHKLGTAARANVSRKLKVKKKM